MSTQFKVGDRVKIVNQDLLPVVEVGSEGTVTKVEEKWAFPILVETENEGKCHFRANELEVLPEAAKEASL